MGDIEAMKKRYRIQIDKEIVVSMEEKDEMKLKKVVRKENGLIKDLFI